MRNNLREALRIVAMALIGACAISAPGVSTLARVYEPGQVRVTVEIRWGGTDLPALPAGPIESEEPIRLELTSGRIIEALAWPTEPPVVRSKQPSQELDGLWVLGREPSGRVRVRVEAPLTASFLVHAGGQVTRFPIAGLLDGPQKTLPQAAVEVRVERLPWDALEVHLTEGDGTVAPGSRLPLSVGFNLLTHESIPLAVRYGFELRPIRGGPSLGRIEAPPEVVNSNALNPPTRLLAVPMPTEEGTYSLEVRADWEPAELLESSRFPRILKRRPRGPSGTVVRRLSVVVLSPQTTSLPVSASSVEVDEVDFARSIGHRPLASGRQPTSGTDQVSWTVPEAALVDPSLRDRLQGWIARNGADAAVLPMADPTGLAWSAVGLRVPRPGKPHRLTIRVEGGHPEALGVALVVPSAPEGRPRILLDARASGPPVEEGAEPAVFSWPVWPDATDPVLIVINRSKRASVRLASVKLTELSGVLPPASLAENPPGAPRLLALHLPEPSSLDRFGGAVDGQPADDLLAMSRNLAGYLTHLGASTVVLPDRLIGERRGRAGLDGQADEDAIGPDRLSLLLRVLGRRGISAILETDLGGPMPGLPSPESAEARERGLVRIGAQGQAELEGGGPSYQPLHPEVQEALKQRLRESIAPRLAHSNLGGLLIRIGPGATLPGGPTSGLDDTTYEAFLRSMFSAEVLRGLPGQDANDPDRFAARADFVAGSGRRAWLDWRCEQVANLYGELASTVQQAAPGAILAVATPGLDDGPAGAEAWRADRTGKAASEAWKAVGLDLDRWPSDLKGLVVLRGVGPANEGLSHDLAMSPDLDAAVASRPVRGLLLASPSRMGSGSSSRKLRLSSWPLAGDEPLGHALAVLDPRWVVLESDVVAGQEALVSRFARTFRSLPGPLESAPPRPRLNSGVAVRAWSVGDRTYLALANDTPYEVLQEAMIQLPADSKAPVDDLGRGLRLEPELDPSGGRRLVLRLPPFGTSAIRISESDVPIEPRATYLPRRAELEAKAEGLSERLGRLAQGEGGIGPPMPGFEPGPSRPSVATTEIRASAPPPEPGLRGWSASGNPAVSIRLDTDRPHEGQHSLRLDAQGLPASAVSDPFLAPGGRELTIRAWLRADQADARVRVWIEGESGGRTLIRRAEVPAGDDWAERQIRVPDLPSSGLDHLRLRFEWLGTTPGTLWVDDVSVSGRGPSESGRRVQQILTDALHAYRRGRFADFARLLGSHRARPVLPAHEVPPLQTSQSNDLSADQRLR